MNKFSKFGVAAVLAASITSSAVAVNLDGFFIGAQIGANKSKMNNFDKIVDIGGGITRNANPMTDSYSDIVPNLGLKIGYDFDIARAYGLVRHNFEAEDNSNIYNNMEYWKTNINWSSNDFILGADFTPKFSLFNQNFKGILGLYTGYSILDVDFSFGSSIASLSHSYSQNGFIFGAKLGAIYDLKDKGELEFGFKFDQISYKDKTDGIDAGGVILTTTAKGAKFTNTGLFVGYNYKF
nr:hypothetical protein [Campylobacter sp.]